MAQKINPVQTKSVIVGIQGTDHNPLPTTIADSPSSSVTFTLTTASKIWVTYGANFQMNTALTSYLFLNVDGSDVSSIRMTNGSAVAEYWEGSRVKEVSLAAGSHTIKLRGQCSLTTAAVNIAPYWYGTISAQ